MKYLDDKIREISLKSLKMGMRRLTNHGSAVVRGGDGSKSLLPGRVPDLQLYLLAAHLYRPDLEIDAYNAQFATESTAYLDGAWEQEF